MNNLPKIIGTSKANLESSREFVCVDCANPVFVADPWHHEMIDAGKAEVSCEVCFKIERGRNPELEAAITPQAYVLACVKFGKEWVDGVLEQNDIKIKESL